MTHRPTLALCIPAYNAASFLPRLLASATNQLVPFDEILVYDDCSSDDTAQVARAFGATVVVGDVNRGCSVGKNRLLAITKCQWVHFHDADDDLLPVFTTYAHEWIARTDSPDVVLFDYESREFGTEKTIGFQSFSAEALAKDPSSYTIRKQINPYCGLYKTASLRRSGGYDEDPAVLFNEDCRFHMHLAFSGLSFGVEPRLAVINLERSGSMSKSNRAACFKARLVVLQKAAVEAPARVRRQIGLEAWQVARHLGAWHCTQELATAIVLGREMGVRVPEEEPRAAIRLLAAVAPEWTFRARAWFVSQRDRNARPASSNAHVTSSNHVAKKERPSS